MLLFCFSFIYFNFWFFAGKSSIWSYSDWNCKCESLSSKIWGVFMTFRSDVILNVVFNLCTRIIFAKWCYLSKYTNPECCGLFNCRLHLFYKEICIRGVLYQGYTYSAEFA
jgi:hypothetical protein